MGSLTAWIFIGGVLLIGTIVGTGVAWFIVATANYGGQDDEQPGPY